MQHKLKLGLLDPTEMCSTIKMIGIDPLSHTMLHLFLSVNNQQTLPVPSGFCTNPLCPTNSELILFNVLFTFHTVVKMKSILSK